jgi:lysozyme family protein
MYTNKFEKAFEEVLYWEGGYVNHPKDPGGCTKYGISQK